MNELWFYFMCGGYCESQPKSPSILFNFYNQNFLCLIFIRPFTSSAQKYISEIANDQFAYIFSQASSG